MKDYIAFVLTLIFLALIFIGFNLYEKRPDYNNNSPSTTDEILGKLNTSNLNEEIDKSTGSKGSTVNQEVGDLDTKDNGKNSLDSQSGSILAGKLCYPSQDPFPLDVYVQNTRNRDQYKKITTTKDQQVYRFDNLPEGKYIVYAYAQGNNQLYGGYTKAVPCGMDIRCNDHKLIEISMSEGQIVTYADICDWYGAKVPGRPDQ